MEENFLIHGPVRKCPGLVFPIYPYFGEKDESLHVGRREVGRRWGPFSRMHGFHQPLLPGGQAGRQVSQIVVVCSDS